MQDRTENPPPRTRAQRRADRAMRRWVRAAARGQLAMNPVAAARPGPRADVPRVVGWLGLAGVSLIAGIASYFHALDVVEAAGATAPVAYLVPALADLVILGASADWLASSRDGRRPPVLTMVAVSVGVVVTLAMNVAAGWHYGWGGRLVSGWPALAFILALESLSGLVRRGRGPVEGEPEVVAADMDDTPDLCPHAAPSSVADALRTLIEHGRDCLGEPLTYKGIGDTLGIDRRKVAELVKQPALNGQARDAS